MSYNKIHKYALSISEFYEISLIDSKKELINKYNNKLIKLPGNKYAVPSDIVQESLKNQGVDYSFKVIAHINMKGGIGKTTTAISTATRAKQFGFKTCIIDMDSQANASLAFNKLPEEDEPIFYDIWNMSDETVIGSLKKIDQNLYILPSSLENSLLDSALASPVSQKNAVKNVCSALNQNGFNLVIIDCPPSLGTAVISTICAADIIIIPVCNDTFSFKGLDITLNEINCICDTFNLKQPKIKTLFTKFDKRLKLSITALEKLQNEYKQYYISNVIRTSSEFSKTLESNKTIFAGYKKSNARTDYDRYVKQLLGLKQK